jgi:RNA polymerase sigma-70 factor (ECF subfamily)
MTGSEQDAEDVVQESFLKAYQSLNRFESRANFGTWLHRIVANCSVDFIRSRQSRQNHIRPGLDEAAEVPSGDLPGPERLARSADIRARVDGALSQLSALERAAFTLRHFEGRHTDEIGELLGLGTSAVKHSVFRAVRKVRAALEPVRRDL